MIKRMQGILSKVKTLFLTLNFKKLLAWIIVAPVFIPIGVMALVIFGPMVAFYWAVNTLFPDHVKAAYNLGKSTKPVPNPTKDINSEEWKEHLLKYVKYE